MDMFLSDEFPSVVINGRRYHYGREDTCGKFLVQNLESETDFWCFDDEMDMVLFLVNVPESAQIYDALKQSAEWASATTESERLKLVHRELSVLQEPTSEKLADGRVNWFRALQVADSGQSGSVKVPPEGNWDACNEILIAVSESQASRNGRNDFLVRLTGLRSESGCLDEYDDGVWKINRDQALRLASRLIMAAEVIEKRASTL
jgi:hypothetical protein